MTLAELFTQFEEVQDLKAHWLDRSRENLPCSVMKAKYYEAKRQLEKQCEDYEKSVLRSAGVVVK